MKKIYFLMISCIILLLTLSCVSVDVSSSTVPFVYTNNQNTEIEILGEVFFESRERVGYYELLKAARNLYPDCDYVIDIMVDQKITTTVTTTSFFMRKSQKTEAAIKWVMRGTAVKYKR